MGRAPARSLGVLRGGLEGIRANRNALNPLQKINRKALLYKKIIKMKSLEFYI